MKKVVLLASIMLFCLAGIMNAQENRKEQREARREAARKKIQQQIHTEGTATVSLPPKKIDKRIWCAAGISLPDCPCGFPCPIDIQTTFLYLLPHYVLSREYLLF